MSGWYLFRARTSRKSSNEVALILVYFRLAFYQHHVSSGKQPLVFLSSDSHPLYKADIFRCLALPDCYTIQFRYPRHLVLPEIASNPSAIIDAFGVIVFVDGNDQTVAPEARRLTFHPIRFCTVKDAVFDVHTRQLLVILQLHQFVNCNVSVTEHPPRFFATRGIISSYQASDWLDCANRVKKSYADTVFFRLNRVLLDTERVSPSYLKDFQMSRFELDEETDYSLECLYYDPSARGDAPLSMQCDSPLIQLSNTFVAGAGADLDKRYIHLKTGLLKSRSDRAFITFSTSRAQPPVDHNDLQILWEIRRKKWKDLLFPLCVLLGALGLGMVQIGTKSPGWSAAILLLLGASFVATSAGLLYRHFNKT